MRIATLIAVLAFGCSPPPCADYWAFTGGGGYDEEMDEPWDEKEENFLRLARELVERVVELGVDCVTVTIASEGKIWRVSIDEVDAEGNVVIP